MSQDIKCACRDRTHTHYTSPLRVVRRTNSIIPPPTGTPRPRDLDHRDQCVEEHMRPREQSGATALGWSTLELVWPPSLPPGQNAQPWPTLATLHRLTRPCPLPRPSTHDPTHGSLQLPSGLFSCLRVSSVASRVSSVASRVSSVDSRAPVGARAGRASRVTL